MTDPALHILHKLKTLPEKPGIYLMKNARGKVIYVGKANSLAHRVRSYFGKRAASDKVGLMREEIADVEWILVGNEVEALLLESNFIKKYHPHFNVLLRDDKQYPYLKLTVDEQWPRLLLVRKVADDKAKYYGPYPASSLKTIFQLIRKLLPIRWCPETPMKMRTQACLYYHIKQCIGPCLDAAMKPEYDTLVKGIDLLLSGHIEEITETMRREMIAAAEHQNFEEAARLRDRIYALESMQDDQRVVSKDMTEQDILALATAGSRAVLAVLAIREGKLVQRHIFPIGETHEESRPVLWETLLLQYYGSATDLPREVIIPEKLPDAAAMGAWLSERAGQKVRLTVARGRSKKKELIDLAFQNARHELERRVAAALGETQIDPAVIELQNALSLPTPPFRIECFDISHISGSDTVASMVVFENGRPLKSDYRKFKIKLEQTPDDVASIYEVVSRRYGGSLRDTLDPPDLIVIDGGIGQVGAAETALKRVGESGRPLIGLAKRLEEIYTPHGTEPLHLPRTHAGLKLIQRARDEAHRFAVTFHKQRRSKRFLDKSK